MLREAIGSNSDAKAGDNSSTTQSKTMFGYGVSLKYPAPSSASGPSPMPPGGLSVAVTLRAARR
jgi:hypothetical protein